MGKRLIVQRRGRGSGLFRAPSHRFVADVIYPPPQPAKRGEVVALIDDPAHSSLIAEIVLEDRSKFYNIAAEGICIGDDLYIGCGGLPKLGSILPLAEIPDGTPIFNVELSPGDGGKVARASGAACYVVAHERDLVVVALPSKRLIKLSPQCRATLGAASGGGRVEKPLKKAGAAYYKAAALGRYWPIVRGTAMSAYAHPHGGRSFGKPKAVARVAPPGAKVGAIAARRMGRRKGKITTLREH